MIANSAFADVDLSNSVLLKKGDPAPYAGVLLTTEQAKVIYGQLKDYDKIKLLNSSLEKSIEFYRQNEVLYLKEVTEVRDQNLVLQTALDKVKSNSFWQNALWFVVGLATTSVVVYATKGH